MPLDVIFVGGLLLLVVSYIGKKLLRHNSTDRAAINDEGEKGVAIDGALGELPQPWAAVRDDSRCNRHSEYGERGNRSATPQQ